PFRATRSLWAWAFSVSERSSSRVGRTSSPNSTTARPSRLTCRNSPITMARSPTAAVAPMAVHTIWGGLTPGVYRGVRLGRKELLDEPVVLQLEVEPDDVVDGERRALGTPLERGDLVVEE